MGELVVLVSFRFEISSIRKRKGPQIDLRCQNFEVFVVFDAISVDFSKDFVLSSQSTQQRKNELCNVFFKRTLHVLLHKHFRMTPKESKNFNFVFVQLVYFLNHFGVRMSANVQQRLNSYSIRLSGDYLQISVGKWLKSDHKNRKLEKFCRFLTFSVNFF